MREVPGRVPRGPRRRGGAWCDVVWEFKTCFLASTEGDDAADRIIRRDPDGHAIARNHLDAKAAHPAAQLGEHFVALVTLHAIQPAAVNRNDRALHVNQIILAQLLSFPIKDCAILWLDNANGALQTAYRGLDLSRESPVVIALQ